jgi:type IV secretion system protein VirB4
MLDGLLRLPHEFVITQSFSFVDRQTSLNVMNEASRKMAASESGAQSLIDDIGEAIDDLASGQSSFGEHHLSITAIGKNKEDLEKALSECNSQLINLGIVCAREDINLEPAFWANLPGNFSYIARRSLISSNNFASLASFHNFPAGKRAGNHWGEAITKLETTSGTPYWFNFHERDVGNFTLIGPTGSGKTVLLTFLMAQAQRLSPTCVYFDKDRGAEIFLRVIGGDYEVIRRGHHTGLNPLQLPDTPQDRAFLKDWLKILIEAEGGDPLSPQEHEILSDAIAANYEAPLQNRRLSCLSELLSGYGGNYHYSLAKRISSWHGRGERAWLFDNELDSLPLQNPVIGFDLTSILDDPVCRTPWLMYIFHRINALLDGRKTIIMLDEGWKMLDDPAFSARIKDWMKTIRKLGGIVGFATQSAKDAIASSVGDAIIEQSPTQIFLPNARAQESDYCTGFGLSRRELQIVRNLTPESRCFLLRHGKDSVIAKLDLSGMSEFIDVLSGRAETVRIVEELMASHGPLPENWLSHFRERSLAA